MNNQTNQKRFKAHTIKIIILLMFSISLLPIISAFEFDNVKELGNNGQAGYQNISIVNAFGFGDTLWEGELRENTDSCKENCYAIQKIKLKEAGSLIDSIRFETILEDGSRREQSIRSYEVSIKQGNNWIPYTLGTEMPKGNYKVRIAGEKKPTRTVDWIITSQGIEMEEWAIWAGSTFFTMIKPSGGFDGSPDNTADKRGMLINTTSPIIITELNFNPSETKYYIGLTNGSSEFGTGDLVDGRTTDTIIIPTDTGVFITSDNDSNIRASRLDSTSVNLPYNFTGFNVTEGRGDGPAHNGFWINILNMTYTIGEGVVTLNTPEDGFVSSVQDITFNASATVTLATLVNMSIYHNGTGVWHRNKTNTVTGTSNTTTFNVSIADVTLWNMEACDSDGDCGFALVNRTVTFDGTDPAVSVTSPSGDQGAFVSGVNLSLVWTATDTNLDTCFYDYDGVNTTVACGSSPANLTVTDSTKTSLIFYANDSANNLGSDTTSWTYSFVEIGVAFATNDSETASSFFQINLTTGVNVLSINSRLDYAGVEYQSTASCSGQNCTLTNTIDLPLVATGESVLNSFFWNFTIFDGTSETEVTTSTRTQNVSRIHIEECDATFTVEALNFTAFDETDSSRINPFYFAGDFNIWLGSGGTKRNNSFSQVSIAEETLCISPPERDFTTSAIVEYNEVVNSSTYDTRNYFFQQDTINNQSQSIPLFLLKSDDATSFILKLQDTNLLPIANALIIIERFNPGTGNFTVVSIAKTDDSGQTVGFFKTETVDYRFIIKKNGLTLLTTVAGKVVPETAPFTLTFTVGADEGAPWALFEDLANLTQTLEFNATSGNVTFTYVDSSNTFTLSRLTLLRNNPSNLTNSPICDRNSTFSSATLICGTGNITGTYTASAFITRGSETFLVVQIIIKIQTFSDVVGLLGVFLAWFIILISAFAFKFNEIAGIVLMNLTVIMVNLIGLVNFGFLFVFGMMGVSILIIVMLKK